MKNKTNHKLNVISNISIGIVLIASLLFSYIQTEKVGRLRGENNIYLTEKSTLRRDIDSLHTLFIAKDKQYLKIDSLLDIKTKEAKTLKLSYLQLQSKYADLEHQMSNITPDSSYSYTMHRLLPIGNSFPYKFAPNQVKDIHYSLLALDQTKLINKNLEQRLIIADSTNFLNENKFTICKEQTDLLLQENSKLKNLNEINESMISNNKKEIRKQKNIKKSVITGMGIYIIYKGLQGLNVL